MICRRKRSTYRPRLAKLQSMNNVEPLPPNSSTEVMAASIPSNYFDQFLNGKPTVHELYEHVRVGTNWHKLGVLLKLDIKKLNDIRSLNEDSDFKSLKMFELWLSSKPNATRREIIETLKKDAIGDITVAERYRVVLQESKQPQVII